MIIDIWMIAENVQKLGIAERFLIYIAIYIFCLSNLLIFLLNNSTLYHSDVSKNLIVFSMFDCL